MSSHPIRPIVFVLVVASLTAAVSAAEPQQLLPANGKAGSLEGWRAFHQDGTKLADVWTLDADGVLHCKGKPLGYLYTEKDYTSFVLELDWRWPPGEKAGNGGVLIRTTGPDKIWPKCLEAQINAGSAGDFWGLDGYTFQGPAERFKSLAHPQFGKLTNLQKTATVEKPTGQWNHYKITADGTTVTLEINGQVVNRATACAATPGRILLTAEGNPIDYRDVRLTPILKP